MHWLVAFMQSGLPTITCYTYLFLRTSEPLADFRYQLIKVVIMIILEKISGIFYRRLILKGPYRSNGILGNAYQQPANLLHFGGKERLRTNIPHYASSLKHFRLHIFSTVRRKEERMRSEAQLEH